MFSPSVDARSRHKSHDEVILHILELSNSKFQIPNSIFAILKVHPYFVIVTAVQKI
jgi:hypothetical protein